MFLSFIVPIYNAEKYIKECLDSLLEQDLSNKEYEIICVNDGSTDQSLKILADYENSNNNIRIINKENRGVSSARNNGLGEAAGEYVWFIDADDFIQKNILNALYLLLRESDADVIQIGAYPFFDELSDEERVLYENGKLKPKSYANNVFVTRNIFKREFLNHHGITFYTELSYSEDKVFVSEVLARNPVMAQLKRTCYYYRYHAGSAIAIGDLVAIERKLFMWIFAIRRYQEAYISCRRENKPAIADNPMSEVYSCFYTIAGLPSDLYREVKSKLQEENILSIKRPKECTLERSYLVDHSRIVGKLFDFVYVHLDSKIGFFIMRCIRLANRKRKMLLKQS